MIGEALKDLLRYLPSRVVPGLVAIAAIPVLTRLLPPAEYGRYTLALSAVALFTALTSSWLTTSAIRFVPSYEQPEQLGRGVGLLAALFLIALAGGSMAVGVGGVLLTLRGSLPGAFVALAVVLCAATASHDFLLGLLRSRRRATTFTTLTSILGTAGYALAVAMAILIQPSAPAVVGGFLLAVVLVVPFTGRMALRGVAPRFSSLRSEETREILRYGLPALVINGLTWVAVLSDRYVLAIAQGESAVGIYAASRDLSDKAIALLNTLFLLASTPVGMTVWERDGEDAARAYVVNLTRYYLLAATPLAVGIGVLAQPLIGFLADARYHEGYRLVPFVAAGAVCAGLATRYTLGLSFRKRTGLLSLCYLGAGVINLGLNLVLVPRYGYMAAAAANLIAFLALLTLVWAASRSLFAWPFPVATGTRVGVAVTLMGFLVWLTTRSIASPGLQLAVGVPVGMTAYALAILAVGALEPRERAILARRLGLRRRDQPSLRS